MQCLVHNGLEACLFPSTHNLSCMRLRSGLEIRSSAANEAARANMADDTDVQSTDVQVGTPVTSSFSTSDSQHPSVSPLPRESSPPGRRQAQQPPQGEPEHRSISPNVPSTNARRPAGPGRLRPGPDSLRSSNPYNPRPQNEASMIGNGHGSTQFLAVPGALSLRRFENESGAWNATSIATQRNPETLKRSISDAGLGDCKLDRNHPDKLESELERIGKGEGKNEEDEEERSGSGEREKKRPKRQKVGRLRREDRNKDWGRGSRDRRDGDDSGEGATAN
ncbi:hypothetical protein G7Y89_g344 [Cudoniella acicularis]|uniref:Uncharacterized protein n=1 Tax=Cudoniella acicularis TaxID=354080 RepID=A0A8H4RZ02_9HELO|nr:hypothetical protein G7Y89_g344 [Cudoniella acicularis]